MDETTTSNTLSYIQSIAPLSLILIPHIIALPPLKPVRKYLASYFSDLVPLHTLVSDEKPTRQENAKIIQKTSGVWRQILLVGLGAVELGVWMGVTALELIEAIQGQEGVVGVVLSGLMVLVWLYLLARPLLHPPSTPPWTSLASYTILWIASLATLSLVAYIRASTGHLPGWASTTRIILEVGNIVICSLLIAVIGTLRLASPEVLARMSYVSPDDEVTLFSWLSFSWVTPFIHFGASQELSEDDIPNLSLSQQTSVVFDRFRQLSGSTLLIKLFKGNLLDLSLDALLTLISVVFNYAGPFFLKRILDGIANPTKEAVAQAYVFAILAFLASVLKAGVDLLHLWHSRRACVRIKNQLIAAIYDKALRRKDASGLITAKTDDTPTPAGGEKKVEKKANADSGKVVNLMSGDTNRVSNTVAGLYWVYGAPLEIITAGVFLYNILGWSAFAGIIMVIIAVPLNSMVSKRSVAITKDLLKARDGRISVMNELIGAIQFIKFFAWVEQWKTRASDARAKEMKQMIRSIINGVWFSLLWNITPIMVTLLSFFSFILIEKRELTVSIAFTSIALFTMVRMPLNIVPTFVVILLQAHVAVKRIEDFLDEDEVPEWVSSLKRSSDQPPADYVTKIGFENATLCWNSGAQGEATTTPSAPSTSAKPAITLAPPSPTSSNDTTAVNSTLPATPQIFNLSDLNVSFPIGKLSVITGPTGSGKSAMLTALLGEMELLEGKSFLPKYPSQAVDGLRNSIAYCSQTPWLQQKSIKDNILFGEEFDEKRYEEVLEVCALVPDLDVLEDGDQTEIGAKGVSLSGGQKARVALARAVYSYTQHLLLDDPLAAVDSHTAKHLTDKCLNGPLLKGRTVIIVSHHVELLLPSSDYIVRILDGRIDAQGTPSELREAGELDGLVALEEAEVEKEEPITSDQAVDQEVAVLEEEEKKKKKGPGKKLVQDEERAVGNVKWQTYKLYIVAATAITWVMSSILLVASQLVTLGERWWLKIWGEAYNTSVKAIFALVHPVLLDHSEHVSNAVSQHRFMHFSEMVNATTPVMDIMTESTVSVTKLPSAVSNPQFYLYIYTAIVLGDALLGVLAGLVGSWSAYRACTTIHDRLLETVMRATVRFFNVTPVGRIINRFSRDIETIDTSLNSSLRTVIVYFASLFGAVGLVAVIVPWFLVPACVISYIYYRLSVLYLRTGRSLRRLEATSRSPIFSGFAELLDGVVSVRAFSVEKQFMALLCEQVDKSQTANYYYWMLNRWLLLRFDVLGAVSVGLTTLLALSGAVSAGSAGMAIYSAQGFVSGCYWVSRFWGQLEMDFNAVERVEEYLHLAQEPPGVITNNRPPAYWPSGSSNHAFLSARDVEIKYAPDLPTVFKGSFEIKAGEKIGLIGRTGSGKSTLAMTLLRFTDPTSGSIWLDGIDITSIGVDDLRSRITYIPQDAVLFSGTVRENLDPFEEHSDQDLLDALSRVNLGPSDTPLPSRAQSSHRLAAIAAEEGSRPDSPAGSKSGGKVTITLSTEVSAGGSNFSQGQRQLVAMARALLRRSNLIIMDEATASVDFATDEAIQQAIRAGFKSSCVITIAHRIASVIDYDRLLVLSDGKVAEFDTPINLLRKDDSIFKGLCESSGKYKELYKAAEKKESGGE